MVPNQPEKTSQHKPRNLAQKIVAIMAAVTNVAKDKKNEFHNYKYVSDEATVTALRTAMVNAGVILTPSQKSCTEIVQKTDKGEQTLTKLEVEFILEDADSGEKKTTTFFGYGTDKGDKGIYKAMTGAEKYFLLKTFLVPTGDDPEAEAIKRTFNGAKIYGQRPASPPLQNRAPQPAPATPAKATPPAPAGAADPLDFPPPNPKVERQIMKVFLDGVTLKTAKTGSSYFKLNATEGESWTTFSKTIAERAKDYASKGAEVLVALDMQPGGAVAVGIRPA